jgi:hypothetical protein
MNEIIELSKGFWCRHWLAGGGLSWAPGGRGHVISSDVFRGNSIRHNMRVNERYD